MSRQNDPSDLAPVPRLSLRREEAAEALGISSRLLSEWLAAGTVPYVRRGGVVLFPVDQLREWLAAQTVPAQTTEEVALARPNGKTLSA